MELLGRYSKTPAVRVPASKRGRSTDAAAVRIHAARKRLGPAAVRQLVSDYEAGHSTTVLMQTYGLGKGTVLGILEEHGVEMRGQGISASHLQEVIRLYREGHSLMGLGVRFDCSAETVRQALLGAGVTLRKQWERGPLRAT